MVWAITSAEDNIPVYTENNFVAQYMYAFIIWVK